MLRCVSPLLAFKANINAGPHPLVNPKEMFLS